MTSEGIIAIVIVAAVLATFIFDAYAIATGKPSVSSIIKAAFHRNPILAFLLGALVAHILWPTDDHDARPPDAPAARQPD